MALEQIKFAAAAVALALAFGCCPLPGVGPGTPPVIGDPSPVGPGPSGSGGTSLAGTWTGTLACSTGEQLPATYKIAPSGNPIYEYQTSSGPRVVELTSPGQSFRFVPPERGVATVTVEALSVAPDRIAYTLSISEERTSGDTLTQSQTTIATDATLSGAELAVQMTIRSTTTLSQPGHVVPGETQTATCQGRLRKQ
jgi:hypothetical protein